MKNDCRCTQISRYALENEQIFLLKAALHKGFSKKLILTSIKIDKFNPVYKSSLLEAGASNSGIASSVNLGWK